MSFWTCIAIGILVNFIWGTAFLIPHYLPEVNPMAIAIGRYLVYGLVSIIIILINFKNFQHLNIKQWRTAFLLAFSGNVGYYVCLSMGVHYGGITISALIIGILPISILIIGNMIEKTFSFRKLLFPVCLIFLGIIALNIVSQHNSNELHTGERQFLGAIFAVIALVLWTWYALSNAKFLKQNQKISAQSWSTAIGICCLLQCVIALPLLMYSTDIIFTQNNVTELMLKLLLGSLFLGLVVSWLATVWWNQISRYLPVAVTGQLIIFETISSLLYGYALDQTWPSGGEILSAMLIILGVILGIHSTMREEKNINTTNKRLNSECS